MSPKKIMHFCAIRNFIMPCHWPKKAFCPHVYILQQADASGLDNPLLSAEKHSHCHPIARVQVVSHHITHRDLEEKYGVSGMKGLMCSFQ